MKRLQGSLSILCLLISAMLQPSGIAIPRVNTRMVVPVQAPVQSQMIALDTQQVTLAESQKLARLQTVIDRLKTANGLPATIGSRIILEDSPQLNAATDGQALYITRGMLNALTTEDQMAFVISHELSHITLNHIPKTALRRGGWELLDQTVLGRLYQQGGLWDVAQNAGIALLEKKFSRSAEYQADDRGLAMMAKAGYDPKAAVEVLALLQASSQSGTPEFLQDHPLNKARIDTLSKKYKIQFK